MLNWKFILLSFLLLYTTIRGNAQGSSCLSVVIASVNANVGDTVSIPVYVNQEVALVSAQFSIFWDSSQLEYIVLKPNLNIPEMNQNSFNVKPEGEIIMAWYTNSFPAAFFLTSTPFYTVQFKIKSGTSLATTIGPKKNKGILSELVDGTSNRIPTNFILGEVSTATATSPLKINRICLTPNDCSILYGLINIEVSGGTPGYTYTFTGPGGGITTSDSLFSTPTSGYYDVVVEDQAGDSTFALVYIKSNLKYLSVFSSLIEQPTCANNDGKIFVEAINGVPPYTYNWTPAISNSNTVSALPAGIYRVTVTDALGCSNSATFSLNIAPGFSLETTEVKPSNCGTADGILSATVSGKYAPFSYWWNTGDTTSSILGASGSYELIVTDAQGCTQSKTIQMSDSGPASNWITALASECLPTTSVTFVLWNAPAISPPLTLNWSNGTVQTMDTLTDNSGFMEMQANLPSGQYHLWLTDAASCRLFIPFQINCDTTNIADSLLQSCLSFNIDQGQPIPGSIQCKNIKVNDFQHVNTLDLSLEWDPATAQFIALDSINLPEFNPYDLKIYEDGGAIRLNWSTAVSEGLSLPDGSSLFKFCYLETGLFSLRFSDDFTPFVSRTDLGSVSFSAFDVPQTNYPCALIPDCPNDGFGGFDFNVLFPDPNTTYQLYQHGILQKSGITPELTALAPGTYRASFGGNLQQSLLHIPPQAEQNCVWPGDADDNAAVNHHDLLYIGLAFENNGPSRGVEDISWTGQKAADWSQKTGLRKINFKNTDTNGDGVVTAVDTLAIIQNWGRVINSTKNDPWNAPLNNLTPGQGTPLSIESSNATEGESRVVTLLLGTETMPATDLHGLSFSINYDPELLKNVLHFKPIDSWLGNADELLYIQRNFPDEGRIDIALTRKDGLNKSGFGPIAALFIIIEDDIFLRGTQTDVEFGVNNAIQMPWEITNIQALAADESLRRVHNNLSLLTLSPSSSSHEPMTNPIKISPNPGSGLFTLNSTAALEVIVLHDCKGQKIPVQGEINTFYASLDLSKEEDGLYFLQVFTKGKMYIHKLLKYSPKK